MKVSYAKQNRTRKNDSSSHDGIVIRFHFDSRNIGYASYYPWVHLGQRSIESILDDIARNNDGQTYESLLYRCWFDCFVAQKAIDDIESLPHFMNHSFLGLGETFIHSRNVIKIKLIGDIESDCGTVLKYSTEFHRLRLDANFKYSQDNFIKFLNKIEECRDIVEYIEDPYVKYRDYSKEINGFNIAVDQPYNNYESDFDAFKIISKPNLRFVPQNIAQNSRSMIFSSNMGDAHAQWLDYHTLIRWGNLDIEHGLVTPEIFSASDGSGSIFQQNEKNQFKPSIDVVKKAYDYYEGLKWTDI